MNLRLLSLSGFGLLVVVIILLLFNGSLVANNNLFIGIQVIAVLLLLWARITFGRRSFHAGADPTEGGLVQSGPYRYIRHPIYASILYFVVAGVLSHISVLTIGLALVAIAAVGMRVYSEEVLLVGRYPEYKEYAAHTKRFIPFIL